MSIDQLLKEHAQTKSLVKGAHAFRQGDRDESLYVVQTGLLKAYYILPDGKESIKTFLKPGSMIGSLSANYNGGACTFNLVALQDARLSQLPFTVLLQGARKSHEIAREVIEFLLALYMKKEQREYELLSLPAAERYQRLCAEDPDLIEQVTQNDIALYLGITPVALSRIKKRLQLSEDGGHH
jgi:CRP-like cAMP-binding protein